MNDTAYGLSLGAAIVFAFVGGAWAADRFAVVFREYRRTRHIRRMVKMDPSAIVTKYHLHKLNAAGFALWISNVALPEKKKLEIQAAYNARVLGAAAAPKHWARW